MKEGFVELTLEWRPLTSWMFVGSITYEFILGLDVMHVQYTSDDLKLHELRLGEYELSLRCPGARSHSSLFRKRSSKVGMTPCGRVAAVPLEGHLEAVDSLQGRVSGPPMKLK